MLIKVLTVDHSTTVLLMAEAPMEEVSFKLGSYTGWVQLLLKESLR